MVERRPRATQCQTRRHPGYAFSASVFGWLINEFASAWVSVVDTWVGMLRPGASRGRTRILAANKLSPHPIPGTSLRFYNARRGQHGDRKTETNEKGQPMARERAHACNGATSGAPTGPVVRHSVRFRGFSSFTPASGLTHTRMLPFRERWSFSRMPPVFRAIQAAPLFR